MIDRPGEQRDPASMSASDQRIYITPEGAKKLEDELNELWNVERRRVTHEVSEAAALGDRSENAEYIYGKKRLREIDSRVRFLRKRLDQLVVVEPGDVADQDRIFFGARVTLENESGTEFQYHLVGPDEIDPSLGKISIQSPLGRVLIGKEGGDEVVVDRPSGRTTFTVVDIQYGE